MDLIKLASDFAREKHKDQKRKYTGEPYFNHCEEVATLVSEFARNGIGFYKSEEIIAAAYLHDTVEDTDATLEEIEIKFGKYVAKLVDELTDASKPSDGNRKIRKEIDRQHTAKASPEGKSIKLADLISNSRSIVQHDKNFAKVYLAEKERLLEVLKDGDEKLWQLAYKVLQESQKQLISNALK